MNFYLFIVFTVEISYSSILVNLNQQGSLQKAHSIVNTYGIQFIAWKYLCDQVCLIL